MKAHIRNIALKNLANAPYIAAKKTIDELPTTTDKDEAKRLFKALGVNVKDNNDGGETNEQNIRI